MKKETRRAYVYNTKCFECNKSIPIYVTLPDFGDPPIIKKCRFCDELYWYTPDDEYYRNPLEKQLEGKTCVKCNADLSKALVPIHTHIKCCDTEFSLDDDFADCMNSDGSIMENIEVYLIY